MQNAIRFEIFEQFPELVCGVIGKPLGVKTGFDKNYQIKYEENLKKIIDHFEIKNIRIMYQMHGILIHECDFSDKNEIIAKTDGLITKKHDLFLVVKTADCVPIFFYEPTIKTIGVVHAGWKGTLKQIAGEMITNIVRHGGRAENIFAAVGPYIHDCCYNVASDRFLRFKKSFSDFIFNKSNFLDLGKICVHQMLKLGVPEKQIELSDICTKCNHGKFYSFRAGDRNVNNVGMIAKASF